MDDPGRPPLPTRLMAGLAILKHTYDLSDEVLCERWVENPCYQFFCGEEFFQHRLVFDRSSLTRWRNRMGEARLQALLQESLSVATRTKAIKPYRPCQRASRQIHRPTPTGLRRRRIRPSRHAAAMRAMQ
jgi:IS5 family transposase